MGATASRSDKNLQDDIETFEATMLLTKRSITWDDDSSVAAHSALNAMRNAQYHIKSGRQGRGLRGAAASKLICTGRLASPTVVSFAVATVDINPHDCPRPSLMSRAVHKVRKKLPALYIDVPSSLMPSFARSKKTPVFRQQSPRFRPLPGDLWCGSARKEGGGHPEASHSADPHLVSACTDHAAHRVQAPPRSSWPPAQVQLRAAHAVVRSAAAHQQDFQELLESRPPVDMVPAAELKQLLDFGRSHDTKSRRHVDQCCAKKKGERVYT